jgi:hypothetical protein
VRVAGRLPKRFFSYSTASNYQPLSNFTGMTFHSEGLRHPEEIRGVFNPMQMDEMRSLLKN